MTSICDHGHRLKTRRVLALAPWLCALALSVCALLIVGAPGARASLQDSLYAPVSGSPFTSDGDPYAVAFYPGGGVVADANYAGNKLSVYAIDPDTGSLTEAPTSPVATGNGPVSLAFSPSGAFLATANLVDGTVSVFSVDAAAASSTAQVPPPVLTEISGSPFTAGNEPYSIAFNPSGSLLATANYTDGTVSLFSVNGSTGALTPVPGSPFTTGANPRSVAFSAGGLLATANGDDTVSVFSIDPSTSNLVQVPGSPFADSGEPYSVAFNPAGNLLATANALANQVAVFAVGGSGGLTPVAGSPFATDVGPRSVIFSPNGAYVATTNFAAGDVSMFDVGAGGRLTPAPGSPIPAGSHPHGAAFSPDYQAFAVANAGDGTISEYQFNLPTAQITYPAPGSTFAVGQPVEATYTCADGPYGAGLKTCADGLGGYGGTGYLDTSTPGTHTYTVNAISFDGLSGSASITYNVVWTAPANVSPPTITGKPFPGDVLRCNPGVWTGRPKFTYSWRRSGRAIAAATHGTYTPAPTDADVDVSCVVTASNQLGRSKPSSSSPLFIKAPSRPGCPAATGALQARTLGLIKLGMTRTLARKQYRHSTLKRSRYTDLFCVAPTGIEVGYPTPKALRAVSPGLRGSLAGRVVWAVTANPYYSLSGISPGARLRAVRSRLTHALRLDRGRDPWYLLSDGPATGIVQFHAGTARLVGIANTRLTAKAPARAQLLASLP